MGKYFNIADNWYYPDNDNTENDKKDFKCFIFRRFGDCQFRFDANTLNKLDNNSPSMKYIKIYIKNYTYYGHSPINEYYITDEDDIIDAEHYWETANDT